MAAACAAGVTPWDSGLQLLIARDRFEREQQDGDTDQAAAALEELADKLDYFPADRSLICSLTGEEVPEHRLLAGCYWRRHATEPANVEASVHTLFESGCDVLMELGASSMLSESTIPVVTPPNDEMPDNESLLRALAELYVCGASPDFTAFDQPWNRQKISLPTYPFRRKRYWITDTATHADAN